MAHSQGSPENETFTDNSGVDRDLLDSFSDSVLRVIGFSIRFLNSSLLKLLQPDNPSPSWQQFMTQQAPFDSMVNDFRPVMGLLSQSAERSAHASARTTQPCASDGGPRRTRPMGTAPSVLVESPLSDSSVMSTTCDCNEKLITSKDGITLSIPKGAIKKGDSVIFSIATDLFGPFTIPSNRQTDVVSPYIWICASYHFQKPIQVEFEHYGACDPSHYQLLCCEDDDESYTMRPVDHELRFSVREYISLCTFFTTHFCSYCLFHHSDDHVVNRIGTFLLKPEKCQYLHHFTVEIWFSFITTHCLRRNRELYTKKGMILDTNCSHSFEAASDKYTTSYFALKYVQSGDGWCIDHSRSTEIQTKEVNFYNFFKDVEDLSAHEENALFPPRFILNVVKKPCSAELDTNITVTLYKDEGRKLDSIAYKLFVSTFDTSSHASKSDSKLHCSEDILKPHDNANAVASLTIPEGNLKSKQCVPSMHKLVRYLMLIPDEDIIYFVTRLLPKESATKLIKDVIRSNRSREYTIEKICEAFLKEKDPSWMEVHRALRETGCSDLAGLIEISFNDV